MTIAEAFQQARPYVIAEFRQSDVSLIRLVRLIVQTSLRVYRVPPT